MTRFALLVVVLAMWPMVASAQTQQLYGNRLQGAGGWLLPVPTLHLGSDEADHTRRGSINSWDLVAPAGTVVYAAAPGVVRTLGCNLYESGKWATMQGYGCALHIQHSDSVATQYGHCAQGSFMVQAGQQVTEWTPICTVGWTGQTSFGPHIHFVILRGGGAARIDSVFNKAAMYHQRLSNAKGSTPVTGGVGIINTAGTVQAGYAPTITGQQSATTGETFQMRVAGGLRLLNEQQRAMLLWVMILIPMWLVWVSGGVIRTIVVSSLTSLTIMVAVLWWLNPVIGQPVMAAQAVGPVGNWRQAYQIVQGAEGWKCTNDGAYTMGGVTQGTYNRWRAKHGIGSADVCANLTRAQAEQIFYEMFWLPVGADKMPWGLALTVVDHYYNTGKVSHLLAQCGQDVKCFNNARVIDYRSKKACRLYCAGWINRVTKIRKYTEVN